MSSINSVSKYLFISLLVLCLGAFNVSAANEWSDYGIDTRAEDGAASGDTAIALGAESRAAGIFDDNGNNFDLENVRVTASLSKSGFDAVASLEYDGSDLDILNASLGTALYGNFANVKVGRFLMPADRNIADVPYHTTVWYGTDVVSKWSSPQNSFMGDGVSVSGAVVVAGDLGLDYSVGVFDGGVGDAIIAARADIAIPALEGLALGVNVQSQNDAFGAGQDFFGVGVDALYTTALSVGVAKVTASFVDYDLDGAAYTPGSGRNAGDGFSAGTSLLLNNTTSVGPVAIAVEPFFLYQNFDYADGATGSSERFDVGANFHLTGFPGSKVTVGYFSDDPASGSTNDGAIVGLQVVF